VCSLCLCLIQIPVWDSATNPMQRRELFPILTPAFPAGNSSFNVSRSSRDVMVREFKLGYEKVCCYSILVPSLASG
jgi:poly(A) polymerase Pap1